MRLAINIVLWAIAIASGIMCVISTHFESTEAAHGWNVIFIGFLFAAVVFGTSVQIGKLVSKIARAAGTVESEIDQAQVEKDLELADRQVRLTRHGGYITLVATVVFFGLDILGRWLHPSNRSVFSTDLIVLFSLLLTIHAFGFSALQRRLVALYRQLLKAPTEE